VEKFRRTTAHKCCVLAEVARESALFISSKPDLPLFGATGDDEHE